MSQVFPHNIYYVSPPNVYPGVYVGAGGTGDNETTPMVVASLGSDAILRLKYLVPTNLPSGTAKLRLLARAAATSGAAKVNPKWAAVAVEEDPSSATLTAEGTNTITWGAGDSDVYKELKVTLDADTIAASNIIVMDLTFETTSWTLAANSAWVATVIWE